MKINIKLEKIFSVAFLFLLAMMLIFGHWQLNKQSNKLDEVQEVVIKNSQTTNAMVNFINTQLTGTQP